MYINYYEVPQVLQKTVNTQLCLELTTAACNHECNIIHRHVYLQTYVYYVIYCRELYLTTSFSDIAKFLKETASELQKCFDTICTFKSLSKITEDFNIGAAVTLTQLHSDANRLCYKSSLAPVTTGEYSTNVVMKINRIDRLIGLFRIHLIFPHNEQNNALVS